jgi:hypothetical protein
MNHHPKTAWTLGGLTVSLLALAWAFLVNLWGRPVILQPIPPVDPQFTNTATVRSSYADLLRAKDDVSDFDCYACHERNKPAPVLRFDTHQNLILPDAHTDIVMGHGHHNRDNNCYN